MVEPRFTLVAARVDAAQSTSPPQQLPGGPSTVLIGGVPGTPFASRGTASTGEPFVTLWIEMRTGANARRAGSSHRVRRARE